MLAIHLERYYILTNIDDHSTQKNISRYLVLISGYPIYFLNSDLKKNVFASKSCYKTIYLEQKNVMLTVPCFMTSLINNR